MVPFTIWAFILFIFFGIRIIVLKKDWCVSNKIAWLLLVIHLATIVLLSAVIILYFYDLSFRGYDSSNFIFISCIGSGIPFYLFRKKTFLLPALNYILTGICVFTVPAWLLCLCITISEYKKNISYDNDRYRLETTFKGIMGPKSFPDLFVKKGIIEKKYTIDEESIHDVTSIHIHKKNEDSIQIIIYHNPDTYEIRPSPYIIMVKE